MARDDLREAYRQFTTGVALITTSGKRGPNVMAAEWTFHVSYNPFLISVHIGPRKATYEAIVETGEFGVNIVSEEQLSAMAFAGHFTGREVCKLSSEVFETYPAKRIRAPMIRGCLLNAECRLVKQIPMGDHTAFVGEVIEFSVDASKRPVVLHKGARRLGPRIEREVTVVVSVTPAEATSGDSIAIDGELMASERGRKALSILLLDRQGETMLTSEATTDDEGYFSTRLRLPAELRPDGYRVVARYGQAEGGARLRVL
jgi:flavin reductase (DIM6/NTAB) family NADH-FMN oxidoreductase RutF